MNKFPAETPEVDFGIRSLHQAARLVAQVRREIQISPLTKNDRSPVTVADFAVQALVAHHLLKEFPRDPLVAEENSAAFKTPEGTKILQTVTHFVKQFIPEATTSSVPGWVDHGTANPSDRFWVMDPIDGTKGFLRGEQYAIALALIENGIVKIGWLACPNLKEGARPDFGGEGTLAVAVRGKGSWHTSLKRPAEFRPLQISPRRDPSEAIFLGSIESRQTDQDRVGRVMNGLGARTQPVFMDSLAKYVFLASGQADILLRLPDVPKPEHRECIWDQAPGAIMVEEAGGKVTDFEGKKLNYSKARVLTASRGILVSNGHIHSAALEALKGI